MSSADRRQPETILVVAANPSHQVRLQLDYEVRAIQRCFRNLNWFDVRFYMAATSDDLRRALLDHRPHYLHFCGHGHGNDGLAFDDMLVPTQALTSLFRLFSDTLKCVILNSCFSSIQATAISQDIECVVGMRNRISDAASLAFATGFYDAIAAGESIERAVAFGRIAIQNENLSDYILPVLFSRSGAESLVESGRRRVRDWDSAPDVEMLFGREVEAATLAQWILQENCRIVLLMGFGGIGKTDLATCLARGGNRAGDTSELLRCGIQDHFDYVVWRKLFNANPPEELLADLLAVLSDHRKIMHGPAESQITEILRIFSEHRCLILLDNAEAVLRPSDRTMRYREGYEAYGSFLSQVAKVAHRSCVIITSREKPREVAALEGGRKPVRTMLLSGLEAGNARQIFEQFGTFVGEPSDWAALARIYRGSPLALDLAARHIIEPYEGNITQFLQSGKRVFADLQDLLDWHLDRLTTEEMEIMYWLAIEREPVSISTLYEDLLSPDSRESIASTLQNLQRRMPLEKARGQHFAIQPVLVEHITSRLVHQIGDSFNVELPVLRAVVQHLAARVGSEVESGRLRLLNEFALIKATARENVRVSQKRLIVDPILDRLTSRYGKVQMINRLQALLDTWRIESQGQPGYVAGNILNMLIHLGVDLTGKNLSALHLWQVCLQEIELRQANCSFSEFRSCTYRQTFGSIFALDYGPDGNSIVIGDEYGEVRIVEAANGQTLHRCLGHSDGVTGVAFSPDGERIASSSYDNSVRIWLARTGHCENVFLDHKSWVYSLAIDKLGEYLASCDEVGVVVIRCLKRDAVLHRISTQQIWTAAVAFSPDSRFLAFAGKAASVTVLEIGNSSNAKELVAATGKFRTLTFSPDGSYLLGGTDGGEIYLWSLNEDGPPAQLTGHSGSIRMIAFDPEGEKVVTGGFDATLRFWNYYTRRCFASIQASGSPVWAGKLRPDGQALATGSEDSALRIWDAEKLDCLLTTKGFGNSINAVAFVSGSSDLVSGGEDRAVRRWDLRTGRVTAELKGHASRVLAVACSPDGKWLASSGADPTIRMWDAERNQGTQVLAGHGGWIGALAFSANSSLLLSGAEDDQLFVWEARTGKQKLRIKVGALRVYAVTFCDSDKLIVAGGGDGSVRVFSPADGKEQAKLMGHSQPVRGVHWLGDSRLASCSEEGDILIWNLDTGECQARLDCGAKIFSVALVDNRRIACGLQDGRLQLWDVARRDLIAQRKAHGSPILALCAHAESLAIASAADRGLVRLWNLSDLEPKPRVNLLQPLRPYEGTNITGATGLSAGQRETLKALGAIEFPT